MHRNICSQDSRNHLSRILNIENLFNKSRTMSGNVAKIVSAQVINGPGNVNFIRAKRIIHETLRTHYIVAIEEELPPATLNDANVGIEYRCIPYEFLIDAAFTATKNGFHCTLINLTTEDSVAITFSNTDVEFFISNTNRNIVRREEKYDDVHKRIRDFVKGKKVASRAETPIPDPDGLADFPTWW